MTVPPNHLVMETYEIGLACVEITPPVGTPIAGNFRTDYASRGVYAPLCSRTVVIRRDETALAIITNDLLMVPDRLVRLVRQEIASRCELKPDCIMVSATHTHSGPAVEAVAYEAGAEQIQDLVIPGIVESCVQAFRSCKPAQLWAAAGRAEGVCFNRRLRLVDGRTVMNWTRPSVETIDRPLGPVDTQIGVLAAGKTPDNPCLVLANLALHPAILAGDNWLMGTDWPGYYYDSIARVFGPGAQAIFAQGAEGNVNHIDAWDSQQGRGFKEAQRIGSVVGLSVAGSLRDAAAVSGPIMSSVRTLRADPRKISPEQLVRAKSIIDAAEGADEGMVDGISDLVFARDQIKMAGRADPFEMQVQVFRIGQVAVVALPGEFFVEYALEIKAQSPAELTLVVGLANGYVGYVPTPEAFEQGGYEPTSWRFGKLVPEAGNMCVKAAIEQLGLLFDDKTGRRGAENEENAEKGK